MKAISNADYALLVRTLEWVSAMTPKSLKDYERVRMGRLMLKRLKRKENKQ